MRKHDPCQVHVPPHKKFKFSAQYAMVKYIKPVALHGSESWTLDTSNEDKLIILRKNSNEDLSPKLRKWSMENKIY